MLKNISIKKIKELNDKPLTDRLKTTVAKFVYDNRNRLIKVEANNIILFDINYNHRMIYLYQAFWLEIVGLGYSVDDIHIMLRRAYKLPKFSICG